VICNIRKRLTRTISIWYLVPGIWLCLEGPDVSDMATPVASLRPRTKYQISIAKYQLLQPGFLG
jgi:hypothetical protein